MGTDYYPRLTAVAHDDKLMCEAVNTQTEIALLLAVPGLAATIIFAPLVITIFYSGKFDAAADILRWSVYGVFGRVVSWPLGFIMLAKGMGKIFFCTETFANAFYVAAIWLCTKLWGLPGTGIAFLMMYIAYTIVVYVVGYATIRTTWNSANRVHIIGFSLFLAIVGLVSALVKNPWFSYSINLILLVTSLLYCFIKLSRKAGVKLLSL